jgi:hypothetical protein
VQLPRNRSWFILGALLFGACGGGGSDSGDPASAFAGTWVFKDGAVTPSCSGVTVAGQIDLTGNTAAVTRTDAHHIALAFSNAELTCGINFTVSGSTATADASQACTISVMGATVPVAIKSWTMALSGSSISMSMSGTASVFIVSCTPSGTGTLVQP